MVITFIRTQPENISSLVTGSAFAEDAQPPPSPIPQLPSPPEVVRTLSETIFSGPDVPSEQAPPLKDAQQQNGSGDGSGDGDAAKTPQKPPAAKKQNGQNGQVGKLVWLSVHHTVAECYLGSRLAETTAGGCRHVLLEQYQTF